MALLGTFLLCKDGDLSATPGLWVKAELEQCYEAVTLALRGGVIPKAC